MKYIETVALGMIVIIQLCILSGVFMVFWNIVQMQLFYNRFFDQFLKLVIGGSMLVGWLIEWYILSIVIYRRIKSCSYRKSG